MPLALTAPVGGRIQIPIYFPNGSTGFPSISFSTAPTTGFYLLSGTVQLSIAGSVKFTFSSTVHTSEIQLAFNTDGSVTNCIVQRASGAGTGIYFTATSTNIAAVGVDAGQFDNSVTATHTRFLVYDVSKAAVSRVTVGANDSGGAGFKLLRVPN